MILWGAESLPGNLIRSRTKLICSGALCPEAQSSQAAPAAHLRATQKWIGIDQCFFLGLRGNFVHPFQVSA